MNDFEKADLYFDIILLLSATIAFLALISSRGLGLLYSSTLFLLFESALIYTYILIRLIFKKKPKEYIHG